MPESSNHSTFFSLKTRENWEGTSYQMVRLVCRHFAADERFARQYRHEPLPEISPDFAFFRHISRVFPRVGSYSNHSQDHGLWQVCMCVCVCVVVSVYVVRCCACGKTLKTRGNREKCVWYGVCVVWCCEVREYTKTRERLGKLSKHGLLFEARKDHPRTEKRSKIGHFHQRIVFTFPLGLADDFGPRS